MKLCPQRKGAHPLSKPLPSPSASQPPNKTLPPPHLPIDLLLGAAFQVPLHLAGALRGDHAEILIVALQREQGR